MLETRPGQILLLRDNGKARRRYVAHGGVPDVGQVAAPAQGRVQSSDEVYRCPASTTEVHLGVRDMEVRQVQLTAS